jgi:hypothetical protein
LAQDQLGSVRSVQAPGLEAERELDRRREPRLLAGRARLQARRRPPHPGDGTQRLLLEKGDIDIARKLTPEDLTAVGKSPDIAVEKSPKGALWYMGLNQKNANLAKPEVREALKWLVDYNGIVDNIMKGKAIVRQTILPQGFLGALGDTPYKLDVPKAKELLAKAGLPDGFAVTIDVRNNSPSRDMAQAIQATWGQAGVRVELIPADNKQTLTKYRARSHDIYLGEWGPDYQTRTPTPTASSGTRTTRRRQGRRPRVAQRLEGRRADGEGRGRRPRVRRGQARRGLRGAPAAGARGLAVRDHGPEHRADRLAQGRQRDDLGPELRRQPLRDGPQGVAAASALRR